MTTATVHPFLTTVSPLLTTVNPLLTTVDPQFCNEDAWNISKDYIHWFLIPAVAIILLLCFMEKRKALKPNILGGRPAVVRPLGFLDEPSNRWGVMLAFGSVTGNILAVTLKLVSKELDWPIWGKIFMVYILCLETSVVCYPLFACMTTRHKLVGAIAGLLYSLGWFAFEMVQVVTEGICFGLNQVNVNWLVLLLMTELPVTICNALVVLKFCLKLFKCIRKGIYKISPEEQVKLCRSFHLTYVKHLMNQHLLNNMSESITWTQRIHRKILRPVPGFRFPIGVMITIFMSGLLLYSVSSFVSRVTLNSGVQGDFRN
ncbi:stimulated by retinoic acid gene 6 protein-like isoform X1 [Ruditapes philippinarum]|uniref:stimulated by retinoic acid gene 6 protein-like isoform X1 n=1 Tax=Ruditapes philippinarum TaxID=129788 RepID=UPI00295B5851|nr:stimulated by retinoic acid gene 6 protein-like isoform X1 [Ruditapes philippinarum]